VSPTGGHEKSSRSDILRQLSWWMPPCIYALGIFYASSLSQPPAPPSIATDKHVHIVVFGGLALLLLRAFGQGWPRPWRLWPAVAAVASAVAYGAFDEWHQSFVPGRQPELADLAADALGAWLAVCAAWAIGAWRRRQSDDGRVGLAPAREV
jgi:VanZ family protein